jgi:hypothetical protein
MAEGDEKKDLIASRKEEGTGTVADIGTGA